MPLHDSQSSTRALVARGRAGDRLAFDRVFDRVTSRVRGWFRGKVTQRTAGIADTQDVIHDAALGMWQRLPQLDLRRPGDLDAYMQTAVTNRIRAQIRRAQIVPPPLPLDGALIDVVDDAPTALDTLLDADAEARYRRAFAELPERDRAALVARSMGYTYEQVAAVAGHSSADAARIALTRIVKRLRAVVDSGPPKAG